MSIRPVDMQVILPKSLEVVKADNNLSYRSDAQQQEFSELFQKKTQEVSKQVLHIDKSENNTIDRDREKNNKNNKKKKKKKKNVSLISEEKEENKNSTSMYDITI